MAYYIQPGQPPVELKFGEEIPASLDKLATLLLAKRDVENKEALTEITRFQADTDAFRAQTAYDQILANAEYTAEVAAENKASTEFHNLKAETNSLVEKLAIASKNDTTQGSLYTIIKLPAYKNIYDELASTLSKYHILGEDVDNYISLLDTDINPSPEAFNEFSKSRMRDGYKNYFLEMFVKNFKGIPALQPIYRGTNGANK